jgi:thioredoxin reductase
LIEVAIIGAGPYGLSIAAHLGARGVDFRIFGSPMHTWLTQMPKGMRLKSEGFASSLSDPDSSFTLKHYCEREGIPYSDTGNPVPLEAFAAYGIAFQKKFAPALENKQIVSVQQISDAFRIRLEDGEVFEARKVIVAVGISHFGYVPPILANLPEEFVSHSSRHSTLEHFSGREVVVVGAGASALDLAALLHQSGAATQLVARKPVIRFHDPPSQKRRSLIQRLRLPMTGIGPGWKLFFCVHAPLLLHKLPESMRLDIVRKLLGPAPGWFVKEQVVGKVPFNLGVDITSAYVQDGRVKIELSDSSGARRSLIADHVIAATGFQVDLKRLAFLDSNLQRGIRSVEQAPVLSSNFESSVPGLYFVGTSAANSFGPLMRFAFGVSFVARHLSRHLARTISRNPAAERSEVVVPALDQDEVCSR